jgi:hypothetical protein
MKAAVGTDKKVFSMKRRNKRTKTPTNFVTVGD